jgi:DNA-binding SARP family transcriptional activator
MRRQISLFGGFEVRLPSGELCALATRKARALVAYLAVPAGRFHSREKLTALLWGDTAEAQAKQSFRQALLTVRRALGEEEPLAILLDADAVAFNPAALSVDVGEFEAAVADGSMDALEEAGRLYTGDFLEGFALDEASFEEWRIVERERLRELAVEVMARLLREQVKADRLEPAVQTAQQILGLDPLQEVVHRTLMRVFIRQGRRAAALRQYQTCVGLLERELGVEPEEETRTLYREILRAAGRVAPRAPGVADRSSRGGGRFGRAEIELVGRRGEIAALHQALEQTLEVGARVVIVTGEAGIGKTRLIEEFAAEVATRGFRMLSAGCHATEQPLPFRPWVDALRAEGSGLDLGLVSQLSPPTRRQLGRVFPELVEDAHLNQSTVNESGFLFEAFGELVEELAEGKPTVIVIEDLHWVDAMSARLLAFLARRLGGLPVLIVGTARPEEIVDTPVLQQALTELRGAGVLEEIALESLTREESLTLAQRLRRVRAPGFMDRIADDLWKLSEGNPFVIVESLRAMPADAAPTLQLATTVRDSVIGRLARLPELPRAALAAAAVIGRAFPFRLLHDVMGVSEADAAAAIEELVRRRVLESVGERLEFYHDRVNQVVYEEIVPARRAVLHRAVALALESSHGDQLDDVADQLGHHFLRAGDAQNALVYLKRFADIAGRRYALDAALSALELATGAVDRMPAADRDHARLDLAMRQAFVLAVAGRASQCLALLEANASLQRRVADPGLASEYYFRLAMSHAYLQDSARSRLAGEAALREGERAQDPLCIGKALYALAAAAYASGAHREGIAHDVRAAPFLDHPSTQYWLGLTYWNQAANQLLIGELDAALASALLCDAVAERIGDRRLLSLSLSTRSLVHAARGDAAGALDYGRQALDMAPDLVVANSALVSLGFAQLQRDEALAARETFEQALGSLQRAPVGITWVRALVFLAEAQRREGDAAAASTAETALGSAQHGRSPYQIGLAERVLAAIAMTAGDRQTAEAGMHRAIEAFLASDCCMEAALTRLELVRVLVSRGAATDAHDHLDEAVRIFRASGAPLRVAQAKELARALGLAAPDH